MFGKRPQNSSMSKTSHKNLKVEESSEEQLMKEVGDKLIDTFTYEQLKCHYHPNKQITNFCEEPSCLLPMCPNCVSIHSDFHKQNKQQGQFRTLDVIVGRLILELEEQFRLIKQNRDMIHDFDQSIDSLPNTLRNQLDMLRQKAIQAIDDSFQKIKQNLEQNIFNYQSQNDNQLNMIETQLEQYNQTLLEIQEDIKDDPIPTIVKLTTEKTLDRLRDQMPQPQPLVNNLRQSMVTIQPQPEVMYDSIVKLMDSTLIVKTTDTQSKQQNSVPKAQGYLPANQFANTANKSNNNTMKSNPNNNNQNIASIQVNNNNTNVLFINYFKNIFQSKPNNMNNRIFGTDTGQPYRQLQR